MNAGRTARTARTATTINTALLRRITRLAIVVAAVSALLPAAAASATADADTYRFELDAAKSGEQRLVDWALSRFVAAGLDVPGSVVVFEPASPRCGGFLGRFFADVDTVVVCVSESASDRVKGSVLLHELSHAWAEDHVSAKTRAEFGRLRGTQSWNSSRDPWGERATEHAAVIMAWGLADRATNVHDIGDVSPAALEQAFRLLTGTDPINDGSVSSLDPTAAPVATARLS